MFRISKEFAFSASHRLDGLPDNHPCTRLHGHNYTVVLRLEAYDLIDPGFVLDYHDMAPFKDFLDSRLDHRHLNDQMDANPTAENMAFMLFQAAHELLDLPDEVEVAVGVSETPKTWAWYTQP